MGGRACLVFSPEKLQNLNFIQTFSFLVKVAFFSLCCFFSRYKVPFSYYGYLWPECSIPQIVQVSVANVINFVAVIVDPVSEQCRFSISKKNN